MRKKDLTLLKAWRDEGVVHQDDKEMTKFIELCDESVDCEATVRMKDKPDGGYTYYKFLATFVFTTTAASIRVFWATVNNVDEAMHSRLALKQGRA